MLTVTMVLYSALALYFHFADVSSYTIFKILSFAYFVFLAVCFLVGNGGKIYRIFFAVLDIGIAIYIATTFSKGGYFNHWSLWDKATIYLLAACLAEYLIPLLVSVYIRFKDKTIQRKRTRKESVQFEPPIQDEPQNAYEDFEEDFESETEEPEIHEHRKQPDLVFVLIFSIVLLFGLGIAISKLT